MSEKREKELGKLVKADLVALVINLELEAAQLRSAVSELDEFRTRTLHESPDGVQILVRGGEDSPLQVTSALAGLTEKFIELFPSNVKGLRKYLAGLDRLERDEHEKTEKRAKRAKAELEVAPGFEGSVEAPSLVSEEEEDLEAVEEKPRRKGRFLSS